MNKKKPIFRNFKILLILAVFVTIFIVISIIKFFKESAKMTVLDLTLTVSAPFSKSTITITEDGDMYYVAQDFSKNGLDSQKTKTISRSKLDDLDTLIMTSSFFELEDKPFDPGVNPVDLPTYSLLVRTIISDPRLRPYADPGGLTVTCYEENCDSVFLNIKNKIIELWGEEVLEIGV